MLTLSHVLIAIVEFFLINWLGKHSISSGYHQLSFIQDTEESPLFNVVYRILAPSVFLVISAVTLYAGGFDELVVGYWNVTAFYFMFRWAFNLALGRGALLRWGQQAVVAMAAVGLSFAIHRQFLTDRRVLLPSGRALTDELWIVIILFLYHTYNRVVAPQKGDRARARKLRYIKSRYWHFHRRFEGRIQSEAKSRPIEALAYAVLIYEDFNRPAIYRFIERQLLFPLGYAHSLGPMQVQTMRKATDEELVAAGVRRLRDEFPNALVEATARSPQQSANKSYNDFPAGLRRAVLSATAAKYNVRSDYAAEVMAIYDILVSEFYPDLALPTS